MAKTLPVFVFITFFTSGVALIFSVVALGTNQWVVGGVDLNTSSLITRNNRAQYGLFTGNYVRTVSTETTYQLTITCDVGRNKCAMLCGSTDARSRYLEYLFEMNNRDGYAECSNPQTLISSKKTPSNIIPRADEDVGFDGFINCGLWLSTVIFLALSCLFGIISTILAVLNTVANPVETIFSTVGLFGFNCAACLCSLTAIILWGAHFAVILTDNIGIHDTIAESGDSQGRAGLGYSYWLNIPSCLLYITSGVLLVVRQILINKEPPSIVNLEDKNDNTIILY